MECSAFLRRVIADLRDRRTCGIRWSRSDDRQIAQRVAQPGAAPLYVARITRVQDCYPATRVPGVGDGLLPLGYECYVTSGQLEINYDTGAKVTLHGPAWYEVNSAHSGALHQGTAEVAGAARSRRVAGPASAAAREIASRPTFTLLVPLGMVTNQAAAYSLTVDELVLLCQGPARPDRFADAGLGSGRRCCRSGSSFGCRVRPTEPRRRLSMAVDALERPATAGRFESANRAS